MIMQSRERSSKKTKTYAESLRSSSCISQTIWRRHFYLMKQANPKHSNLQPCIGSTRLEFGSAQETGDLQNIAVVSEFQDSPSLSLFLSGSRCIMQVWRGRLYIGGKITGRDLGYWSVKWQVESYILCIHEHHVASVIGYCICGQLFNTQPHIW